MGKSCLSDAIILSFLEAKTLLVCSAVSRIRIPIPELPGSIETFKVCTLWREIAKSSPELQYIIELWADGMVHADSTLFTCAEALKALRDRRRAWRHLE
jgi:hypothetical protein